MRQMKVMPNPASSPAVLPAPVPAAVRLRVPRLCISLKGSTPAELFSNAESALKDARFLEFRLDLLAKPGLALSNLKEFLTRHRDVIGLATCRRKENGGGFTGSLASELDILLKAAEAGCQIVDLEVESAEHATRPQLARFRAALRAAGTSFLVSFHDFSRTRGLDQAAERIRA
jgi:3-dehydroquinate dehydratase / shikimate dehydrogenase